MKAYDIQLAVEATPGTNFDLNAGLRLALPVLKTLAQRISGWRWWLKWGIQALISALEAYLGSLPEGE